MGNQHTITFQNKGLVDIRAITTIGISVKDNDNPIGQFGTGIKVSLAVLLREHQSITVYRGLEEYTFATKKDLVRGEEQEFILMNGRELGFTTHYGMNWKMWMVYRELASNTMDEDGDIHHSTVSPQEDHTTIIVQGKKFHDAAMKHGEIFLQSTPLYSGGGVEVHEKGQNAYFYRGIKVYDILNPTRYTYNLTEYVELTEDRSLKYPMVAAWAVENMLASCTHGDICQMVAKAPGSSFEGLLTYTTTSTIGDTLRNAVVEGRKNLGAYLNPHLWTKVRRQLPTADTIELIARLTSIEEKTLARAMEFCTRIGYPIDEYPVKIAKDMGSGVHGLARDEIIYLDHKAFAKGTKWVANTLIEEYIHLEFGVADETREMQQILFDKIVDQGEEFVWGEPL